MADEIPQVGRVEIDDLVIRFNTKQGEITALEKTALTLEPGTFTALIGPSAAESPR